MHKLQPNHLVFGAFMLDLNKYYTTKYDSKQECTRVPNVFQYWSVYIGANEYYYVHRLDKYELHQMLPEQQLIIHYIVIWMKLILSTVLTGTTSHETGLEKMFISQEVSTIFLKGFCNFIHKRGKLPFSSWQNFLPNNQISQEEASQLSNFFHSWYEVSFF